MQQLFQQLLDKLIELMLESGYDLIDYRVVTAEEKLASLGGRQ